MAYKIYACPYVQQFGYGIVIVDGPTLTGNTHMVRCHAFFSERGNTYSNSDLSYSSEDLLAATEKDLLDAAQMEGVKRLCELLEDRKSLHYQLILSNGGLKFEEQREEFLMQLHMRLRIDTLLEKAVEHNAVARDFKDRMNLIGRAGRISRTAWVEPPLP
ncbi:hypothetical protein [Solimonas sp. SE-A11]|uniref:hypothetical protein n=1 Tax=Solimonas sp. SE-A11 TaxID=3054954 RepID=UPI00259C9426|nr:hypothetical protein [Solimonas sp. SE-A11]MDM4769051.1 hypothetical protein [Solimonas sp. SE-A11]